jgi:hypothetical protein
MIHVVASSINTMTLLERKLWNRVHVCVITREKGSLDPSKSDGILRKRSNNI